MGLLPEIVGDEMSTRRTIEGFPERETGKPRGIARVPNPEQCLQAALGSAVPSSSLGFGGRTFISIWNDPAIKPMITAPFQAIS